MSLCRRVALSTSNNEINGIKTKHNTHTLIEKKNKERIIAYVLKPDSLRNGNKKRMSRDLKTKVSASATMFVERPQIDLQLYSI